MPQAGSVADSYTTDPSQCWLLLKRWTQQTHSLAATLSEFAAGSEAEFSAFAEQLNDSLTSAKSISKMASTIVQSLCSERMTRTLDRFTEQLNALEEQVKSDAERISDSAQELQRITQGLEDISAYEMLFGQSARTLRILSISAKVRSARIGAEAAQFAAFADEVKDLSIKIAAKFEAALSNTRATQLSVDRSAQTILGEQARQSAGAAPMLADLRAKLDEFIDLNSSAKQLSEAIALRSHDIAHGIEEISTSLQLQDITRQRLEHVRDSLGMLDDLVPSSEKSPDDASEISSSDAVAVARNLVELQRLQLIDTERDFSAAVDEILAKVSMVREAVRSICNDVDKLMGGSASGEATALESLDVGIATALEWLGNIASKNAALADALSEAVAGAGETAMLTKELEGLSSDFQTLALNGMIVTAQGGEGRRSLAAIAEALKDQCQETRSCTAEVAGALNRVGDETRAVGEAVVAIVESNRAGVPSSASELGSLLAELREESQTLSSHAQRLRSQGRVLGSSLESAARSITLHEKLSALRKRAVDTLSSIEADATAVVPGSLSLEAAALFDKLSEGYRMHSQRSLHRATLFGKIAKPGETTIDAPAEEEHFDDNVEFF